MKLHNITFCVDTPIAPDFIDMVRERILPQAYELGLYGGLLTELDCDAAAEGTRTFALQLRIPDNVAEHRFREVLLPEIYGSVGARRGMKVAMFESSLSVIHDHDRK